MNEMKNEMREMRQEMWTGLPPQLKKVDRSLFPTVTGAITHLILRAPNGHNTSVAITNAHVAIRNITKGGQLFKCDNATNHTVTAGTISTFRIMLSPKLIINNQAPTAIHLLSNVLTATTATEHHASDIAFLQYGASLTHPGLVIPVDSLDGLVDPPTFSWLVGVGPRGIVKGKTYEKQNVGPLPLYTSGGSGFSGTLSFLVQSLEEKTLIPNLMYTSTPGRALALAAPFQHLHDNMKAAARGSLSLGTSGWQKVIVGKAVEVTGDEAMVFKAWCHFSRSHDEDGDDL
eukprot:TRINITY_DN112543_c0_g1_i1.p1 TRINITY_DN112543_c0_g1~~TRINITY_DN112543_c0_g1_i1.p1  ORF type:complete len:288 (-),score=27.80 TRINITY_DN112543_c0_g1_i1:417-1280(-)